MKNLFFLVGAVVLLAGCDAASPKSVQYYLEHRDEMAARIDRCRSSGDTGTACQNASQAASMSFMAPLGGKTKRVRTIEEIEADERATAAARAGGGQ